MNLDEIAAAIGAVEKKHQQNQSILVYGDPKSGKTRLAATLAKVPEVTSVHWFDTENGSATLVEMARTGVLTPEEAKKVKIYKILDLPEKTIAWDTIVKCLVEPKARRLCRDHGRVDCPECKTRETKEKITLGWDEFDVTKLGPTDWVVIDSGSQIGTSAINYITKGMGYDSKPGWDEWGFQGRVLYDICTTLQAAPFCNYLMVTHQLLFEEKDTDKKMATDQTLNSVYGKLYPLMGTKNFSLSLGKFFGHVIYVEKVMRAHKAGSSSTYKTDVITGSRSGMRIEDETDLDFRRVFAKLGWTAWKPPVDAANTKK